MKFRGGYGEEPHAAEQDNRVRIPNGTAAVCAYGALF